VGCIEWKPVLNLFAPREANKMILQTQRTSLHPAITAHMAQTMTLLTLNGIELRQKIDSALASNPALELVDGHRCPSCHRLLARPGQCPVCNPVPNREPDEPIIFISPFSDFHTSGLSYSSDTPDENVYPEVEDLPTFVLRQIATEIAPEDRRLVAHILSSLDEDGLLRVSHAEIAQYQHVTISRVQRMTQIIQRAEPVGVGSSNPQEALLVQLDVLSETRGVPFLARRAIKEGLDLLSRRAYNELGRLLNIPASEARDLAAFIHENLNPYPGRSHWGDIHQSAEANPTPLNPDIIISHSQGGPDFPLVVEILSPYAGALRVNPLFREALSQAPTDKEDQWQMHLDQANLLVKCLQQRNHTMIRMMQRIVFLQRQFILSGDAYLLPLTRAHIADALEVHESTISRAVSGKAVQLPNKRIIPLDKFFDRSLQIRTALREIVDHETDPLSDTELVESLASKGYLIARRTVAKYRAMEGILPSRFRYSTSQ
jgi:RNA polymerase sigma-54 factor